jgi:hypothetical protein
MKEYIYIVAGCYAEFHAYAKKKDNRKKYKYVTDIRVLMGLSKIKGYYIGTYYNRTDIEDIKAYISIIKNRNVIEDNEEDITFI